MTNKDQMSNNTRNSGIMSVFLRKDFSKLWFGQFISNSGSQITLIILPLFFWEYTKSAFWLSIITFAQFLPIILFSSFAGMFVDTHNRKNVMILSDCFNSVLIFLIPVVMSIENSLDSTEFFSIIVLLVFLSSTVNRFFYPARYASIPRLVTDDELGIAISITQTTRSIISVIGPIIGVLLITFTGYSYGFLFDSLTFLSSAFMISFIKTDLNPIQESSNYIHENPSHLLGIKKIWAIKSIRYIVILSGFTWLAVSSINEFLVIFVKSDLNMSDFGFGTVIAVTAISAILSGIILAKLLPKINNPILLLTSGFLLSGILFIPFLTITKAWQIYTLYFLLGIFNMVVNIPRNIILLRDTTDNIRGQVTSTFNMVFSLVSIIGLLYGLITISLIGIRLLFFINGVLITLIAVCGMLYLLFYNNLDQLSSEQENISQSTKTENIA